MGKWYKERYVNHRDWILDHQEVLRLSEKEILIVLMIDFMNEHRLPITIELLAKRTGLEKEDTDDTVSLLCAKKYLDIRASSEGVAFRLDGLFDTDVAGEEGYVNRPVMELFEKELKRPLTQKDLEKISDWTRMYERKLVLLALKEASMYQKATIGYIDKILSDWASRNYTADMIEQGLLPYEGAGRS